MLEVFLAEELGPEDGVVGSLEDVEAVVGGFVA